MRLAVSRRTRGDLAACAASALLWGLAAPPFGLWPLGWIAMLPAIAVWARAGSARRAGWLGHATGAGMTLFGFHWFAPMMHQHASLPWLVAVVTLIGLAAYQGISLHLAARAIWWMRAGAAARGWPAPMALIAPVAVVATEQLVPVIFPYQLAVTQVPALTVVQIADLLGAGAITALLVAGSGAIWDGLDRRRAALPIGAAVAGCVVATILYGAWRLDDIEARRAGAPKLQVGLVQPNEQVHVGAADPVADRRRLRDIQEATAALERAGAGLVVWSESSYPMELPRELATDLEAGHRWRIRRGFTVPVVIGATTRDDRRRFNSAILVDGERLVARHDKIHRVLGSEWNPVVEWFPSLEGTLPAGFAGGDRPVILRTVAGGLDVRLGPMICLEDTVPGYARELAAARPNLLVNLTIDTWFGTFAEPWQHRGLAVLRAIESRADMVRAVNTGPSGLIEATGRVGAQTPVRGSDGPVETILVEAAVMDAGDTLYAAIGDALGWLCVVAAAAGWALGRWATRRSPPPPGSTTRSAAGYRSAPPADPAARR
jgi:apolipoprotein N-acyltransferase